MTDTPIQTIAAAIFGLALLHTFGAKQLERLSLRYPRHAGLFHLLGEIEVVFGFWAIVLIVFMAGVVGGGAALDYAESRNYTEPLFVFVVMVIAASRPVLVTVIAGVDAVARTLPIRTPMAAAWLGLAAVPLLGSLITEPAAMTIAAGSVIVGISGPSKYMLVAGAVAGGGLTVIANAPNPAGVALLKRGFADETVSAVGLLAGASGPTLIAAAAFMFL